MYDDAKDDDDLEEIWEDINAEDSGDAELMEMKHAIGNLEKKINAATEKLNQT